MEKTQAPNTMIDVIIIGAGPAGLYTAFTLGLQGLRSHIIDALPYIGGQCMQLYPDKAILDIPAMRTCLGQDLAELLLAQAQPFQPQLHLQKLVTSITSKQMEESLFFTVTLDDGQTLDGKSIVLATGNGAFLPKKINLDHLAAFTNPQISYHPLANDADLTPFAGKHILVSGDLEASLQTANALAAHQHNCPASVTLLHRRDKFRAEEKTLAKTQQLREQGLLKFMAGQLSEVHLDDATCQLTQVSIKQSIDQTTLTCPADRLFILHGLSPQISPFDDWGLETDNKQLCVDTATYQTNKVGIFAIGDAITYPGKRQLIASAFHEASIVSYSIASFLQGNKPIPQLYTTSSSKLKTLLGLDTE